MIPAGQFAQVHGITEQTVNLLVAGFVAGGLFFPLMVSTIGHYYWSDMMASGDLAWFLVAGGVMGLAVALAFLRISGVTVAADDPDRRFGRGG